MPSEKSDEPNAAEKSAASNRVRDHLANQRTLLAWVRTGLALIGLGFVISRFGLLLQEETRSTVSPELPHYSSILGACTSFIGAIITLFSFFLFLRVRRSIETQHFTPSFLPEAILASLIAILGIFLFFYLLLVR